MKLRPFHVFLPRLILSFFRLFAEDPVPLPGAAAGMGVDMREELRSEMPRLSFPAPEVATGVAPVEMCLNLVMVGVDPSAPARSLLLNGLSARRRRVGRGFLPLLAFDIASIAMGDADLA